MADTKQSKIVAFITGAILADGTYEESEKEAVSMIAETLEIDEKKFLKLVDSEYQKQDAMSEDDLVDYFNEISENINEDDAYEIYQFCLQIVFADGFFCKDEVALMVIFAEILGIDISEAIIMMISFTSPPIFDNFEEEEE